MKIVKWFTMLMIQLNVIMMIQAQEIGISSTGGVEVTSALYGLFVTNAVQDGLFVTSAGSDGVQISNASDDGI